MNFIGIWKIVASDECRKGKEYAEHLGFWILCTIIIMTWLYLPCAYILNSIYLYCKCLRYEVMI